MEGVMGLGRRGRFEGTGFWGLLPFLLLFEPLPFALSFLILDPSPLSFTYSSAPSPHLPPLSPLPHSALSISVQFSLTSCPTRPCPTSFTIQCVQTSSPSPRFASPFPFGLLLCPCRHFPCTSSPHPHSLFTCHSLPHSAIRK